jgi:hypothetical protein
MKLVTSFGWDYIVRVRAPAKVRRHSSESWTDIEDAWRYARNVPTDLGQFEIGRKGRYATRFVGLRKRLRVSGRPARRDFGGQRQLRNAREPWILATSLDSPATKVVAIYRQRMQIEETFRDVKSNRFGLSLGHARTASDKRANVLLLLAALTHFVHILLGMTAEAAGLHRRFQANTVSSRRVLSLALLGRLVASSSSPPLLETALAPAVWLGFQDAAFKLVDF